MKIYLQNQDVNKNPILLLLFSFHYCLCNIRLQIHLPKITTKVKGWCFNNPELYNRSDL